MSENLMFSLIVSDMDGTFLNSESDFNRKRFKNLKGILENKNIRMAFCTGKQCDRVEAIVGDLTHNTFIIGDSATRIKYNGVNIFEKSFDNNIGLGIIDEIKLIDKEQTIIACTPTTAFVQNDILEDEKKFVHGSYENVTYIDNLQDIKEDFLKITVHDHKGKCRENIKKLRQYENQLYMVASEEWWIDITDKDVHKGKTVNFLQELLNVQADSTIAFGDGLNDIELFSAAKYKVAMENGYDELKDKANLIAVNNNRDGVLETIELLL